MGLYPKVYVGPFVVVKRNPAQKLQDFWEKIGDTLTQVPIFEGPHKDDLVLVPNEEGVGQRFLLNEEEVFKSVTPMMPEAERELFARQYSGEWSQIQEWFGAGCSLHWGVLGWRS